MANKLIAIVGMCGAGKSDATQWFCDAGWQKVYFGQVTMDELKREGLSITPDNERFEREKLRRELGMGAFAVLLADTIREKLAQGNVVLDGLYSWSEYKYIYDNISSDLKLVAVIADSGKRYERLASRSVRPLTSEQARGRDVAEIENLEKGGPIAAADFFINNNGSREDFRAAVLALIEKL